MDDETIQKGFDAWMETEINYPLSFSLKDAFEAGIKWAELQESYAAEEALHYQRTKEVTSA